MTLREFHAGPTILWAALAALLAVFAVPQARAAPGLTLIMVEETGCRFCRMWDEAVGTVYATTPEGAAAPLHRVKRESPELAAFKPAVYTPTFILVRGDDEIGRITGYPGESFFWEELGVLLQSASTTAPDDSDTSASSREGLNR